MDGNSSVNASAALYLPAIIVEDHPWRYTQNSNRIIRVRPQIQADEFAQIASLLGRVDNAHRAFFFETIASMYENPNFSISTSLPHLLNTANSLGRSGFVLPPAAVLNMDLSSEQIMCGDITARFSLALDYGSIIFFPPGPGTGNEGLAIKGLFTGKAGKFFGFDLERNQFCFAKLSNGSACIIKNNKCFAPKDQKLKNEVIRAIRRSRLQQ